MVDIPTRSVAEEDVWGRGWLGLDLVEADRVAVGVAPVEQGWKEEDAFMLCIKIIFK